MATHPGPRIVVESASDVNYTYRTYRARFLLTAVAFALILGCRGINPSSFKSFAVGSSWRSQKRIVARRTAVAWERRSPPIRARRMSAVVSHFLSRRSVSIISRISCQVCSMNFGDSHNALSASQRSAASAKLSPIPSNNERSSGICLLILHTMPKQHRWSSRASALYSKGPSIESAPFRQQFLFDSRRCGLEINYGLSDPKLECGVG
jgi:hypothetical protein